MTFCTNKSVDHEIEKGAFSLLQSRRMLIIYIRALIALAIQKRKHFVNIKALAKYLHMWGEEKWTMKSKTNFSFALAQLYLSAQLDMHTQAQQLLKIFTFAFKNYVQKCCHRSTRKFEFISILSSLCILLECCSWISEYQNIRGWKIIEFKTGEWKF